MSDQPLSPQGGVRTAGGFRDRLLPWPAVKDITGLSRTTAWRRQKAGDFPLPVQISPGRVGWWESELATWKASRAPRAHSHLPAFIEPCAEPVCPAKPRPSLASGTSESEPPQPIQAGRPRARTRPSCEGQIAFEF